MNLFVLPLHISQKYGPFTEGGGDVTVYAETAKYLVDHDLPGYGISDIVYDLKRYIDNPTAVLVDNKESLALFLTKLPGIPPPPIIRGTVFQLTKCILPFSLVRSLNGSFLYGATNYHVFYGVLAFQFACLLMAIWAFFRLFGFAPCYYRYFYCSDVTRFDFCVVQRLLSASHLPYDHRFIYKSYAFHNGFFPGQV